MGHSTARATRRKYSNKVYIKTTVDKRGRHKRSFITTLPRLLLFTIESQLMSALSAVWPKVDLLRKSGLQNFSGENVKNCIHRDFRLVQGAHSSRFRSRIFENMDFEVLASTYQT